MPRSRPATQQPRPVRHFLGWDGPLLPRAASWLIEQAEPGPVADLSEWRVVVPTNRAGKLLLGMLVDLATQQGRALSPPLLGTPDEVVELVAGPPQGEPAGPLASHLAWTEALRRSDAATIRALRCGSDEPPTGDAIVGLAGVLEHLHCELARHGYTFRDVAPHAASLGGPDEGERFHAAQDVLERYDASLASWGLHDPGLARLKRMATWSEGASGVRVALVGVSLLPGLARRVLERGAPETHALIHAPADLADRFDTLGCVVAEAWADCDLPITDDQIVFADDPTDEVDRALGILAGIEPVPAVDEVVIGTGDERHAALFEVRAKLLTETRFRPGAGMPAGTSRPLCVLALVAALLERRRFDSLMEFVRQPDIELWLLSKDPAGPGWPWWLAHLDRYGSERLPWRLDRGLPDPDDRTSEGVRFVMAHVRELLAGFGDPTASRTPPMRPPGAWVEEAVALLRTLFGSARAGSDDPGERAVIQACTLVRDVAAQLARMGHGKEANAGDGRAPDRCAAPDALRSIVAVLQSRYIPNPPDHDAVEMVSWAEVALDPSPIALVLGMNEGNVPAGAATDPLLPGSLRTALNIPGSAERLARDAFAAASIASSRRLAVFLAPRRDAEGSPLVPSRLLLRGTSETIASRLRRSLGRKREPALLQIKGRCTPAPCCSFPLAPCVDAPLPERLRVTSFRDYLRSPYLFYLRHVLRLEEISTPAIEMERRYFGTLVHDTLESFGRSDLRHSTDPRAIREFVEDSLRAHARRTFGSSPAALIAVQVEHASERLRHWADAQAARTREGWLIQHVEWKPSGAPCIACDEGSLRLSGKIDRIDRNETTGEWAILDYKTSDTAERPLQVHRTRDGEWRDLQLPLYRHLAAELGIETTPTLGYFVIPRDVEDIGVRPAAWEDGDLEAADRAARDVVRGVLNRRFSDLGDFTEDGTLALISGKYAPVSLGGPA